MVVSVSIHKVLIVVNAQKDIPRTWRQISVMVKFDKITSFYGSHCDLFTDINECSTIKGICANGQCLNNVGSYYCKCNLGFQISEDKTQCIDKSLNACFSQLTSERCQGVLAMNMTHSVCCCSIGAAWGDSEGKSCTPCPTKGTGKNRIYYELRA